MPKINPVDPQTATGATAEAYAEAKAQFGGVINLFQVAGAAPNVLKGILALNKELNTGGELTARQTELVAMLVSALNRCDYCVNVHMQVGKSAGVSEADMLLALEAKAADASEQALLAYTDALVRGRGLVSDAVYNAARSAGFSEKALLEVIGVVGLYTTLQYIRHVGDPEQDFPIVTAFDADKHGA